MKKIYSTIIILTLALVLSACGKTSDASDNAQGDKEAIMQVQIVDFKEDSFLVANIEDKNGKDLYYLEKSKIDEASDLQIGDMLKVRFDGVILESYPAQFGNVIKVEKTENKEASILPVSIPPAYDIAEKRADGGRIFYEDEKIVGLNLNPTGVFLYDKEEGRMISEFKLSTGPNTYNEPEISADKKSIYLKVFDEGDISGKILYTVKYDIENETIEKVESVNEEVIKHLDKALQLDNNSWKLEDLYFESDGQNVYPFRVE